MLKSITDIFKIAFNPEELRKFREKKRLEQQQYILAPEWTETRERIKERQEVAPESLIKEKAEKIPTQDKTINNPFAFLKGLDRIIQYVEKEIKDPKRMGLKQVLVNLSNDFRAKSSKDYIIKKDTQKEIIDKAKNLSDSGDLISKISNLFSEQYSTLFPQRSACISNLIRNII